MMISHTCSNLFLLSFFMICTTLLCPSTCSNIAKYEYSMLGPNLDRLPSQDEAIELFQVWKKENGRVYRDLEEMARKFEIFASNLKYITESNAKRKSPSSYRLGLTQFSDWTPKEFQETYLHEFRIPEDSAMKPNNDSLQCNAPRSFDWRLKGAVTSVKNQGECRSCWAFSAVGAIEGINQIGGKSISLSAQELLDCDQMSKGCKGGRTTTAFLWVSKNGISFEKDYPQYKAEQDTCMASSETANRATIDSYGKVGESDNALLCATFKQPVSVGFYATGGEYKQYRHGIYDGIDCPEDSHYRINHYMLIVGYGSIPDGEDYWIVKNSRGKKWGIDGYMWVKRNTRLEYGVCGINKWALVPNKEHKAEPNPSSISAM